MKNKRRCLGYQRWFVAGEDYSPVAHNYDTETGVYDSIAWTGNPLPSSSSNSHSPNGSNDRFKL